MIIISSRHVLSVLALTVALHSSDGLQSPFLAPRQLSSTFRSTVPTLQSPALYQQQNQNDEDIIDDSVPTSRHRGRRRTALRKFLSRRLKRPLTIAVASGAFLLGGMANPKVTEASAPVMAVPKAESRDPAEEAFNEHNRRMTKKAQDDLRQFTIKARQIEAEHGEEAREKFETEYKENKMKEAQAKQDNLIQLKRDLLDQGIDPFVDLEGRRQVIAMDKGVDLGDVTGTQFNLEKEYERSNPKKSWVVKKAANREMIKCMVEDMKNRDIDPLAYFESHKDRTADILDLPAPKAAMLVERYKENLEKYGQISPPKEGEISAKEKMAQKASSKSTDKAEIKRLKAEAKAKAAAEKAEAKAKAAEEKAKAKEEAQLAKESKKKEKEDVKAAAALAASSAAAAAAAGAASATATSVGSVAAAAGDAIQQLDSGSNGVVTGTATTTNDASEGNDASSPSTAVAEMDSSSTAAATKSASKKGGIPIVPVSTFLVAAGGGGYAFKIAKDKSAADEKERQRQLKLLMGQLGGDEDDDSPSGAPALEVVEPDFDEEDEDDNEPAAVEQAPTSRKKKRAFFGGKKSDREVDISELVGGGAKAPEFAKLLAKILTFGAPGRFPGVIALPGDMPMKEFSLEAAQDMLTEAQTKAGLSREESAEVFANVVNCMLIDIVDLASASLKEKDDKLTVDAVSIVVDYMNHAASLYNSIAEGVVITPVTYGGNLGKKQLEQMYAAYSVSGMTNVENMDEDFQNRVNLLQDVFQINEKKAEGIMMKALQKNMMEMMKSGEGMEGMEEMMKSMGGMPGMEGMGGIPGMDGEEMSNEQLKQMLTELKKLKDSGAIPPAEMETVKSQFKEAFGAGIDDIMKEAENSGEEASAEDKEMLTLIKYILED